MSDILIKNMDLPTVGFSKILVYADGRVDIVNLYNEAVVCTDAKAIVVPPHGELVQRSDILRLFDKNKLSAREAVMNAPIIVEASTEEIK